MGAIVETEIGPAQVAEVAGQIVVVVAEVVEPADAECVVNESPGVELAVGTGAGAAFDREPGGVFLPAGAEEGQ